jgi:hypothetical protein
VPSTNNPVDVRDSVADTSTEDHPYQIDSVGVVNNAEASMKASDRGGAEVSSKDKAPSTAEKGRAHQGVGSEVDEPDPDNQERPRPKSKGKGKVKGPKPPRKKVAEMTEKEKAERAAKKRELDEAKANCVHATPPQPGSKSSELLYIFSGGLG